MALDRARIKQRLAAILFAEREHRGGGDARRFAQPEMARLLGYSTRQYQRLENPDDPNLPTWADLERIMSVLDLDANEIFADDPGVSTSRVRSATDGDVQATLQRVLDEVQGLRVAQDAFRSDVDQRLARLEDGQVPVEPHRARGA